MKLLGVLETGISPYFIWKLILLLLVNILDVITSMKTCTSNFIWAYNHYALAKLA